MLSNRDRRIVLFALEYLRSNIAEYQSDIDADEAVRRHELLRDEFIASISEEEISHTGMRVRAFVPPSYTCPHCGGNKVCMRETGEVIPRNDALRGRINTFSCEQCKGIFYMEEEG